MARRATPTPSRRSFGDHDPAYSLSRPDRFLASLSSHPAFSPFPFDLFSPTFKLHRFRYLHTFCPLWRHPLSDRFSRLIASRHDSDPVVRFSVYTCTLAQLDCAKISFIFKKPISCPLVVSTRSCASTFRVRVSWTSFWLEQRTIFRLVGNVCRKRVDLHASEAFAEQSKSCCEFQNMRLGCSGLVLHVERGSGVGESAFFALRHEGFGKQKPTTAFQCAKNKLRQEI